MPRTRDVAATSAVLAALVAGAFLAPLWLPQESVAPATALPAGEWAYTYLGEPSRPARLWLALGDPASPSLVFDPLERDRVAGGTILRDDLPLAAGYRVSFSLANDLARSRLDFVIARDAAGRDDVLEFHPDGRVVLALAGLHAGAAALAPASTARVVVEREENGHVRVTVGDVVLEGRSPVGAPLALGFRALAALGETGSARVDRLDVAPREPLPRVPARAFVPIPGAVLHPPPGYDWIGTPSVVKVGDVYRLYARAHSEEENTGTAVLRYDSRDLASWRSVGVAFTRETLGVRGVEDPMVLLHGDRLYCVISGATKGGWDVYLLESNVSREDWKPKGVILSRGAPDALDGWEVKKPSLLERNGTWHLWYDLRSRDGSQNGLGLAVGESLHDLTKVAGSEPIAKNVWGSPDVRELPDGTLVMAADRGHREGSDGIVLATSRDGRAWNITEHAVPAGAPGTHREHPVFPTWIDAPGKRVVLYEGKHRDMDPTERGPVDVYWGVVAVAARFDGFFEGVTTEVDASGEALAYLGFPLGARAVEGLVVRAEGGAALATPARDDAGALVVRVDAAPGVSVTAALAGAPVRVERA